MSSKSEAPAPPTQPEGEKEAWKQFKRSAERALMVEWETHNARRHDLITKKRGANGLTDEETNELRELQWLAGIKRELLSGPASVAAIEAGGDEEGRAVCDCHTWPTVSEMHDYVEALERIVHGTRPDHKCKPIARAVMDQGRDWWVGELLEPVQEWPKETHCLHMKTPVKDVWFLCNSGDFEQLMVMGNSVVRLESLEWLKSATKGVEMRAAALRTPV